MRTVIQNQRGTTMSYRSKYKPVEQLRHVYGHHKDWPYFAKQLQKGSFYQLKKIPEKTRRANLHYIIKRGNYKSAKKDLDTVKAFTIDDVKKGYATPLLANIAPNIKKGKYIHLD